MKHIRLIAVIGCLIGMTSCSHLHNENYLQIAEETVEPNMNFLYATNASLPGRLYMTFSGRYFKPCINTVTSFYNKYHTCSNCEDFVKNPGKWNFRTCYIKNVELKTRSNLTYYEYAND